MKTVIVFLKQWSTHVAVFYTKSFMIARRQCFSKEKIGHNRTSPFSGVTGKARNTASSTKLEY